MRENFQPNPTSPENPTKLRKQIVKNKSMNPSDEKYSGGF